MFWKKIKTYLCLFSLCVVLLYAIGIFACGGFGLDNCIGASDDDGGDDGGGHRGNEDSGGVGDSSERP